MLISWDDPGSRLFETGVDRGVFYPKQGIGVPWNGITSIKETDEVKASSVSFVDGQKVVSQVELGTFSADISAITYPDELYPYDGFAEPMWSGQPRLKFNLSYRSLIGNDTKDTAYGYRLHLVFNCLLMPSNRDNVTMNESSDILDFNWKLETTPEATPYHRPASHFIIDAPSVEPGALAAVENLLYGVDGGSDPTFPSIQQLIDIFEAHSIFTVFDNDDGTVTITGPDGWVDLIGVDQVSISSPSFNQIDDIHILARSY